LIDLSVLQPVSWVAAAIGVCVAAIYYVMNLRVQQTNMREAEKNRKIAFTTSLMQPFMTEDGIRRFIDLINLDWSDIEDYKRRYDSRTNPENFSKRYSMWNLCENLGRLYRQGLIDLETILGTSGGMIQYMWVKFKPVIEMYRETDYGPNSFRDFEYLAGELNELNKRLLGEDMAVRMSRVIKEHVEAQ